MTLASVARGSPVVTEIHRTDDFVVVNKPSGMAVHRGMSRDRVTVVDVVAGLPVHRLDRGTSGALVLALHADAARALQAKWPTVEKTYLCITRGDPGTGTIDHPVPKDEGGARVPAVSHHERLALFERYALVRVQPQTGRFHQVRRHMKHLSCPLVGDTTYGKSEHNRIWRQRHGFARLALHCHTLRIDGRLFRAPLPEDFQRVVDELFRVPL